MKNKYLIPALVILILAGCYKEQEPIQEGSIPQKGTFNFSSSTGEVTKVLLNSDNTLFWAAGDKIAVYDYKAGSVYAKDIAVLTGGESTAVGTFTPAVKTTNTDWYNAADASDQVYNFYAFYPGGTEAVNPTDGKVTVSVAASQQESVGIGKYIVSWASANTTKQNLAGGSAPNFAFAPKSALLKLTLRNSADIPVKITSIQINAASVNIAGDASLNLGTGVLSAGNGKVITYIPSKPIEIAAGAVASAPVYISLLPCAPGSLTVSLNQAGFKYTVAAISLTEVESGHVYAKEAVISDVSRELRVRHEVPSGTLADADGLGTDHYYGAANCLVIAANATQGILDIALKKSDGSFARSNTDPTKVNAVTMAKVIWAEDDLYNDPAFCISDGNQNRLVISKTAGVSGNALIGIYKESELLWSYHIWCPIDASVLSVTSEGSSTKFTAYKLALGQIQRSDNDTYMYYQWGRKDPMGRSASLLGDSSLETCHGSAPTGTVNGRTGTNQANNLAYARKHPTTWITDNDTTPFDWYAGTSAVQNNDLWNSSAATFNDPCPQGYHVAPKELWAGLTNGSNGKPEGPLFESAGLWYVLGGSRNRTVGYVDNVASNGYCWSSEVVPSQVRSYVLRFSSGTDLGRDLGGRRADGFGVRCVKEEDSSIKREIAISNSNTSNLANSAALDAAYADDATDPSSLYYGAANCVVMGASDTRAFIDIRLKKSTDGYSRSSADPSPKVTAVKKAKVIWAEADLYRDSNFGIAAGTVSQLVIQKSAGVTGNALIGIYDESDGLLWSYHVWCPFDKSTLNVTSEGDASAKFVAFKLALGQVYGSDCDTYMYYQWGRKDPLGRAESNFTPGLLTTMYGDNKPGTGTTQKIVASDTPGSSTNNLSYARNNPWVFIIQAGETLRDWYSRTDAARSTTTQNDNLWKSNIATIYDPCPAGYRVAPKVLWAGDKAKQPGPLFDSAGLWYVLGGARLRTDAGVNGVASYGNSWSSEAVGGASQNSYNLYIGSGTGLNRTSNYYRADGYGVRCVK